MSGRRSRRGSWGEQEEQSRGRREGRRGRRIAWWAGRVREGVARKISGKGGEERREDYREERWAEEAMWNIFYCLSEIMMLQGRHCFSYLLISSIRQCEWLTVTKHV